MNTQEDEKYWRDIFEKFSNYNGTIAGFCREQNIKQGAFYHQRKKLGIKTEPTFHAIELNGTANLEKEPLNNTIKPSTEIRIEIGKAKIYVANTDNVSLATVLKEITRTC